MFLDKLSKTEERYEEILSSLSQKEIIENQNLFHKLGKELSEIDPIVKAYRKYIAIDKQIEETRTMLSDPEMTELAEPELRSLEEQKQKLKEALEFLLIPTDPMDEKNIIVEIRGGTGGDEAALFAGDLLRMYLRYAEKNGWRTEMIDSNPTGLGGYKEAIFSVIGRGAYSKFKYESGTHRVQRVPKTETSGRIHTSAATVAVLPEVEDFEIQIDEKDLKFEAFRAGGAGGQNVNKVSSAVRITHLPTNTVVECREERSQLQNRVKAMKYLRSRLYEVELERQRKDRESARKIMVGTGDRSEKIRTYNFPQGRITDHRIGFTVYQLDNVLDGNLDEFVDALQTADRIAKLQSK